MEPKKLTKPEQAKEDKRVRVINDVQNGLGHMLSSEVVQLGMTLAKRARVLDYDTRAERGGSQDAEVDQIYRSLSSVPANIMEGFGKSPGSSSLNFLLIARGSAYESLVHAEILGLTWVEQIAKLCALVDELVERYAVVELPRLTD